ncbi:MAG: shikimate dehydrogenase [Caldimicrobium sp.]|nr:shikimate dehydrogenase [Caldimicrobium sp.]MCX7873620.1 shikimate dehydrogenase [Caldimicrobium sp.]MDW8094424.1 shikimate dehydrogenase [Caldimicrobium sp.]
MYDVYGIIGDPVSHSLSPVMHNLAFRELQIKAVYGAFRVKKEELLQAIEAIKVLGIRGVSVTIPHKESIISYLDEVSEVCRVIGAVNTVVRREGKLVGYNTDWIGVMRAFEARGVDLKGKRVVIIGAGGASRAVIYACKKAGVSKIVLYNRTWERSRKLAQEFALEAKPWEALDQAEGDIIIQTTSVGLKSKESPISSETLKNFSIAMDIVYLPLKTKFLEDAEKRGLLTIDGLQMLLYQGVEQFKLFTGLEAPVKLLEEALYDEVKKIEKELKLG